jgi:hypothetical protein
MELLWRIGAKSIMHGRLAWWGWTLDGLPAYSKGMDEYKKG